MATRREFLRQVWDEIINPSMEERWIDSYIREFDMNPNGPFADLGGTLKRLLALGASRKDLSSIRRAASYESVFQCLYMLGDPGVDDDDYTMMHESLLGADPSGMEGRPGSAPEKKANEN